MADQLLKKEYDFRPLQVGGSIFFYIALALFFVTVASFGGLLLLNRAQKEARQTLLEETSQKEDNLRSDLVKQIFLLDQRLRNLRSLLAGHIFSSHVLKILEEDTLPRVRFLSFGLDVTSRKIDMTAEAVNYATVAQQIGVLEQDPRVERVEFGGLSAGVNSLAGFKVTVTLKQNTLQLHP